MFVLFEVYKKQQKRVKVFGPKVSLLHYHKLEPIHMSVKKSIELRAMLTSR